MDWKFNSIQPNFPVSTRIRNGIWEHIYKSVQRNGRPQISRGSRGAGQTHSPTGSFQFTSLICSRLEANCEIRYLLPANEAVQFAAQHDGIKNQLKSIQLSKSFVSLTVPAAINGIPVTLDRPSERDHHPGSHRSLNVVQETHQPDFHSKIEQQNYCTVWPERPKRDPSPPYVQHRDATA